MPHAVPPPGRRAPVPRALHPRLVARELPHRRHPARGDHRRPAADRRPRLVALVWANTRWSEAYADLRDLRRSARRRSTSHLDPRHLGRRRAAGHLLLRGRARAQARVRRRRPARPAPGRAAGRGRGRRDGRRPRSSTCCGTSAPAATSQGWAIPTATDIAFAVAILAVISTHLPSGLRTFLLTLAVVDDLLAITDHRALLHRRPAAVVPPPGAGADRPLRGAACSAGSAPAGCCSRSAVRRPGCLCTSRACTPRSPGCCWASPCRCCAASRPADRPDRGWPSTSSTWSGRSRRGRRTRSSRSSPPASTWAGSTGCSALTDPIALGIVTRAGGRQDRRHRRAPPGCWRPSPAPTSTRTCPGST